MAAGQKIESALRQRLFQQDKLLQTELRAVAETYALQLRSQHESVVRDWVHRPTFRHGVYASKRQVLSIVYPTGKHAKLYQWVDEGTKAHVIKPKRAGGLLKFQRGYSARTSPVARFNVGTGRASGRWTSARIVRHPGTKARQFSKTFNRDVLPEMRRNIENAIRRALRRAKG